jgi:KaiC/GvpD/RAD55 family RecA-like ATPase
MSSTALLTDFSMFPLEPRGKRPLVSDWTTRTFDIEKYRDVTGNFAVKADENYCILESDDFERLKTMLKAPLSATYTVQARPNRPHLYFRQTSNSKAAGNMDVPGLFEFKQNNRYVVAEGSTHPTGAVYLCIVDSPVVDIPDWLVNNLREIRKNAPPRNLASEGRHPSIGNWCGKNFKGAGVDDEAFIQGAIDFDAQNNNPPRGPRHSAEYARWFINRNREPAGEKGPRVLLQGAILNPTLKKEHNTFESVLGRFATDKLGGFPLGEVHLIQGSSGSGKTTIGVDMLRTQRDRLNYWGCETYGRSFVVLMLDRSKGALLRTFYAMNLTLDAFPYYVLTPAEEDGAPAVVVNGILEAEHYDVVFIEGLDMWCDDPSKGSLVKGILRNLQKVAEHHHTAIIGSVGAPKSKPKEMYKAPRDRSIGSSLWARKSETIVDIVEDHESEERQVTVMVRSCRARTLHMAFDEDSHLVIVEQPIAVGEEATYGAWFAANPAADSSAVMKQFAVKRTASYALIKKYRGNK